MRPNHISAALVSDVVKAECSLIKKFRLFLNPRKPCTKTHINYLLFKNRITFSIFFILEVKKLIVCICCEM